MLSILWGGQRLTLYSGRAVHWRRAKTLIVADPHFGKAAAFRNHGIPVPAGTTQADVNRLSALLAVSGAKRLIVLGDFLHHRTGRAPGTMATLQAWREEHPSLEIILIRGNHDDHAGDPPPEWNFHCVDEPFIDAPFAFCHDPLSAQHSALSTSGFSFTGHIHPCAILHDSDGSSVRAPCFYFSQHHATLPAFGTFTGAHPIRPRNGDRIFAVSPDSVTEIATVAR
ncbi:MAG: ligase-associated DNA damage response endonuclease PdeM [Phycisphaerales bacterium]|nr:ligase-associated DNA damage response endonuclease PdeM [Phycisphaerales bacterium]MCI0629676.1 ligase-associated DNA damage response endonuclease PdeM [Phycisphaerales bacterium]MCI0677303.1 ligase-associated DNA damage response endonuclease PdeM [Phycisphaerales bacterium]